MSSKLPTVAPPPKKGKLPPVQLPAVTNGQQLPAVPTRANPVKALRQFVNRCDDLKDHYEWLQKLRKELATMRRYIHPDRAQKVLDNASLALREYEEHYRDMAKELECDYDEKFNPKSAYDEDDDITEEQVSKHIGLLLGSYPNANPGNDEAYVRIMVSEVMAECPSLVVLESACSQIRRANKFPPTTAEVIKAIEEEWKAWSPRLWAMRGCGDSAKELRKEVEAVTELVAVAKAEREEQRRLAEEKKRADAEKKRADDELRAKPLVIGDRVRLRGVKPSDWTFGTIMAPWGDGFMVELDAGRAGDEGWFSNDEIERVIPGDNGFEIPLAKRESTETKLVFQRARFTTTINRDHDEDGGQR